jgi:hypothetical protein
MMELDGSIIMMAMPGRTRQRLDPRAGPSKVHHTARHGQQRPEAQARGPTLVGTQGRAHWRVTTLQGKLLRTVPLHLLLSLS